MLLIVLVVLFVVDLFVWFLALVEASPALGGKALGWLPWIAVLILGITVFLLGAGVITWHH